MWRRVCGREIPTFCGETAASELYPEHGGLIFSEALVAKRLHAPHTGRQQPMSPSHNLKSRMYERLSVQFRLNYFMYPLKCF
jgi:hypothetical protein